jgi:serine/threonine-protein kinase RsbW
MKFAELGDSLFSSGFVTSVLLSIRPNSGRVEFVNSGHLLPLVYRSRTGRIQEMKGEGIPLGIFDEVQVQKRHVNLSPGDRLILLTDGIARAGNLFHEEFGDKQLRREIRENGRRFPAELAEEIFHSLKSFIQGRVLRDDITMLVLGRADENWEETFIPSRLKTGYRLAEKFPLEIGKRFGIKDGFHLQVALAEALTNAMVHGNKKDPSKKVRMRSRLERGCLHIEIQDEGSGFNPEKVISPLDSHDLLQEGGRGIFLMKCFCDHVFFEEPGNTVHLIKRVDLEEAGGS